MPSSQQHPHHYDHAHSLSVHLSSLSAYLVPLGRLLFTLIFLESVPMHFSAQGIAYAAHSGVPWPNVLVPAAGVLALAGGLSVLLGYHARIGALLLALFLIPVTLIMHAFWNIPDAALARMQMIMFMKNVSMLGAALMVAHFGAGPISIDAARTRRL
jgi:putative oxidoreductase